MKIRRALFTVSDKDRVGELARAFHDEGIEIVATGRTAKVIEESGIPIVPIEEVSGSPEAFRGRMKTLSFPVCSGILYRRGDQEDEADLTKLDIVPIDCVVVNFYPFEQALLQSDVTEADLIEQIDIGGPTLVRAAAKNAPDVLVLTGAHQYDEVLRQIKTRGEVEDAFSKRCAAEAWDRIFAYDSAIAGHFGTSEKLNLRYGENPHQSAHLDLDSNSPIAWADRLTDTELSYNNILDMTAAYGLVSELKDAYPDSTAVVIVKHNNPCGVALIPKGEDNAQCLALQRAWDGDPVSAFGGVLAFSDELSEASARWLSEKFVELIGAPGLRVGEPSLEQVKAKRKKLKAVRFERFEGLPVQSVVNVPGGKLVQSTDQGDDREWRVETQSQWTEESRSVAQFGVLVCRSLKSNALAIVRALPGISGGLQLVGAGQGQPNRVEALEALAIPRANRVLEAAGDGRIEDCVLVSDAFFPFRDTVDKAAAAGLKFIVQPGGSIKDRDSIAACDESGVAMAFTGTRHFRH